MNKAELIRLKKIVSEIKGYAELYEDLYRTQISSKDVLDMVRMKMEYCREQVLKLSMDLKNLLGRSADQGVPGPLSSLGKQMMGLVNQIFNYQDQKEMFLARLEALFLEYQAGKYSYFEYAGQMESILKGKPKEELLGSYEDSMRDLMERVSALNNSVFQSAYKLTMHNELRIGQAPIAAETPQTMEEARPPAILEKPAEVLAEPLLEIPGLEQEAVEVHIEIPPIEEPVEKIKEEIPEIASVQEEKPEAVPTPEQKAIYETPEEEKEVEELLAKLKSGEIKPTPNVTKWLLERLKKEKGKERTLKEMTLDPSMVEHAEEEMEEHIF